MALQWRTLEFFRSESAEDGWIKSYLLSCAAQNGLLFGTKDGNVVQVNQSCIKGISWQAYTGRVTHIICHDRVVTIGMDDNNPGLPVLKIWDLKKTSNESPALIKIVPIQQGSKIFPVLLFRSKKNR